MLFETMNGQFWIQAEYKYWYHYAYNPEVVIYQKNEKYILLVADQEIQVYELSNVIKSNIDGEFTGWDGDSVYTLMNGQKWQQYEYKYQYKYAYCPKVVIYDDGNGMVMKVNGTSIRVKRII